MAKLDRNRDFGEVGGAAENGARYYQDNKAFDANGDEIGAPVKPPAKKVKAVAPLTIEDQLTAQMETPA